MIPLIALEEHFFASGVGIVPTYEEQFKHVPGLLDKLEDLGTIRLVDMAKGNIAIQVLSHAPGLACAGPAASAAANDQMTAAVRAHPTRFAALAVLPMADPPAAAAELRRAVRALGCVGALVDNHAGGVFYDGAEFRCVWAAAHELDVPVYLHPTWPEDPARFQGNFSVAAGRSIGSSAFGWHVDTGMHVLRLFAAGVFDEFPALKLVLGHMGETLPFMLERVAALSIRWGERKRGFLEVWRENIWVTTSGNWSVNPMATILRNTQIDHILFSVDYPFARNEDGLKFMEDLQKSGLVTEEMLLKIGHKNAETLLGIKISE